LRRGHNNDIQKIKEAFVEYMTVLETYELSMCKKAFLYYEDFTQHPAEIVTELGEFFDIPTDHITKDIDGYLKLARERYISKGGDPRTDGKTNVYFSSKTYEDYDFDWDATMRGIKPSLYDTYLTRYTGVRNE
jgi:hypothetical protein